MQVGWRSTPTCVRTRRGIWPLARAGVIRTRQLNQPAPRPLQGKAEPASLMGKTVRDLCQRLIPRDARLAGDRGTRAPLHFGDPLRLATPLAGDSGLEAVEQFGDQSGALILRKLKGILKQLFGGFRHSQWPDYSARPLCHLALSSRLPSSWLSFLPAAISSRPRSTACKTYRWYWRSSSVQSSGSFLSKSRTACLVFISRIVCQPDRQSNPRHQPKGFVSRRA